MSIFGNKSIVVRQVFAEDLDSELLMIKEAILRDLDTNQDRYASDSIKLLKCQGIDFEKNKEKGINSKDFAKKFWDYGLLFNCYGLKSIT
ncbi:hypothetical protein J1N35_023522 [Gossypium stocksii]|uniref:Uncharacterized protein n=1 Tax=Gossypium stocksii TaxID=47602 RepID=A0A9D3VJC4_9ROSI|nr:hypothetical protein J1N35_023522 [Gossypium stocksii]